MSFENEALQGVPLTVDYDTEARAIRRERIIAAAATVLGVLVVAAVTVLMGIT